MTSLRLALLPQPKVPVEGKEGTEHVDIFSCLELGWFISQTKSERNTREVGSRLSPVHIALPDQQGEGGLHGAGRNPQK